jgi:hypothetical protein
MELPLAVLIHNELVGLKGVEGFLHQISENGYYLLRYSFGNNVHRVLLPIQGTALIFKDPEEVVEAPMEVER